MAMGRSRPRRTTLRVGVARSPSRVWKLCTRSGLPSAGSVRLRTALRCAAGEGSAFATSLAGGASYFQPLLQCGQRRRPIAVPRQTLGEERQTIRASEPGRFGYALPNVGDSFFGGTLCDQCRAVHYARFEGEREPLLCSQRLGSFN